MNRTVVFLLLAALAVPGCGKKQAGWDMVVQVVSAEAAAKRVDETVGTVGTLMGNESVKILAETDGTVEAVLFEEGQFVKEGQTLVEIDRVKLEASYAEAKARFEMAEASWKRYESLLESGAVSRQEADQARAEWAGSKALADRLSSELGEATIKAPFDGIAGGRDWSVGQFIPRGTTVTTLVDPDPMKLEFRVSEKYLATLKTGLAVRVSVSAYPGEKFPGEVYFVDPQVEADTRTVLLKASIPNPDGKLRQGMFANVSLVVRTFEDAVVVPESAVLYQGDLAFVYAVDGESKAQMRPVKPGVRLAGEVHIAEGLAAGESVVAEGHQKIFPGAKVAPRKP